MSTPSPEAGGPPAPPPVCPRHPDREAYVRCQRCERPVCPECQRPAAVGVQCVDCVRDANRELRTARGVFGGGVPGAPPRLTQGIIGVCAVVYLLQIVPGSAVTRDFAFTPVLALAEPYRFITSAFLHSPGLPIHILFNMYALWLTGPYLEHLMGRARFAALYLLAAFGGSVFYLLLADPLNASVWGSSAVGASGAVFGLFAATVVALRRLGRDAGQFIGLIAVNTVLGFLIPNVAWQAHLGGLVTGAAVAAAIAYAPRERRALVQTLGLALVALLLVAVLAFKVSTTGSQFFA